MKWVSLEWNGADNFDSNWGFHHCGKGDMSALSLHTPLWPSIYHALSHWPYLGNVLMQQNLIQTRFLTRKSSQCRRQSRKVIPELSLAFPKSSFRIIFCHCRQCCVNGPMSTRTLSVICCLGIVALCDGDWRDHLMHNWTKMLSNYLDQNFINVTIKLLGWQSLRETMPSFS